MNEKKMKWIRNTQIHKKGNVMKVYENRNKPNEDGRN
jgi:hypothetical protein